MAYDAPVLLAYLILLAAYVFDLIRNIIRFSRRWKFKTEAVSVPFCDSVLRSYSSDVRVLRLVSHRG